MKSSADTGSPIGSICISSGGLSIGESSRGISPEHCGEEAILICGCRCHSCCGAILLEPVEGPNNPSEAAEVCSKRLCLWIFKLREYFRSEPCSFRGS